MNFAIYDTKWQKRWASGNTEDKGFKSICDYLMSSSEPDIFKIVFVIGDQVKIMPLAEYITEFIGA